MSASIMTIPLQLPPLIDHPTWAILAASNRDQNTPVGAVVTSDPVC